jgi:hypothetical protein
MEEIRLALISPPNSNRLSDRLSAHSMYYQSIGASSGRIASRVVIATWETDPYSIQLK